MKTRHRFTSLRGFTYGALLLLVAFAGCRTPPPSALSSRDIVLIEGTTSIPTAPERAYARRLTERMAGSLESLGLPLRRLTDDDITPGALQGCTVAILPYNPSPTDIEREVLLTFLREGGRLVVFYGQDPVLAGAMGFQLDRYVEAPEGVPWSSIRFGHDAVDRGFPEAVRQLSPRLCAVQPAPGQPARVLAQWHPAVSTAEPAIVYGPGGYWMTHVMLEGDAAAKRQMLLAMVGTFLPQAWAVAARHELDGSAPFARYPGQADALADLTRQQPATHHLLKLDRAARAQFAAGRYRTSWLTAQARREALTADYASRIPPSSNETGCIWVDHAALAAAGTWTQTCATLNRAGIKVVFARLPSVVDAAARIAAAQPQGLSVHAWIFCCNVEDRSPETLAQWRGQERLQVSASGEVASWLCPTHPDNRAELCRTVEELARLPGLAGIHLDYIRYRNSDYCFCNACRSRFEQSIGHRIADWPAAVRRKPVSETFARWRADELTGLVEALSAAARQTPGLQISAAVYPEYPGCIARVGQDWPLWLRQETVDFVCPMNYTKTVALFERWIQQQAGMADVAARIYPGIGVSASGVELSPDQALAQLESLRRAGMKGFALFEYDGDSGALLQRMRPAESTP